MSDNREASGQEAAVAVNLFGCLWGLAALVFWAIVASMVVGGFGHMYGFWKLPGLAELIDNDNTEMEVLAARCGVDLD